MVSALHNPFPLIHLVNNQQSQSLDTSVVTQRRCLSESVHSNIRLHNIAAIRKKPNFPKQNLSKIVKYQRYFEDHRTKNNNNVLPVLYVYIVDEEKEGHFVYCQLLILNKTIFRPPSLSGIAKFCFQITVASARLWMEATSRFEYSKCVNGSENCLGKERSTGISNC